MPSDPTIHTEDARDECEFDGCTESATQTVRYAGTLTERVCDRHAWWVRYNEAEWDSAERDYLEQP